MEKALEIMKEEVLKHPLHIDNRTKQDIKNNVPPVIARVVGMGDSSVNLRVWAWAANPSDSYPMYCDLLQSIKNRFDKEGIEIPFPQRDVHLKSIWSRIQKMIRRLSFKNHYMANIRL